MVRVRLRILIFLMSLPFCLALGRLVVLQLLPSRYREARRESRHLSIRSIPPHRGRILDRRGEILAGNVPTYDIHFEYSRLNPRDRLVEILADELSEDFDFHSRERIEARILELARPEELATPPRLPELLEIRPPESILPEADDKEWLPLIESIHDDVRGRIVARWNKSGTPHRDFLEFRASSRGDYFDLWFSREDIVRQEIVLERLARLISNGDPIAQPQLERLLKRVQDIRKAYELRIKKDLGPPPTTTAHAYSSWKALADTTRSQYHHQLRLMVEDVALDVVTMVEMYPSSFPGISTGGGSRRVYPQKEVCGSLLGSLGFMDTNEANELRAAGYLVSQYFDPSVHDDLNNFAQVRSELRSLHDRTGKSGLELYYDRDLRGVYGGMEVERNRRQGRVRVLRVESPIDGHDITTTIDLALQQAVQEKLTSASGGTSATRGTAASAVVMDLETGGLLACAGVPSFDPNRMREAEYGKELKERWGGQTQGWFWDRPTRYPVVPGSVFKIVVAAAAMETEGIGFSARTTKYPCNYRFPDFNVHCNARYGHGLERVGLVDALKHSCNVFFFTVGYRLLTPQGIEPWAKKFGYGQRPGVDLGRGGHFGRLDPAGDIKDVGACHYSIGQVHVEATPLQVARSLSVIATGGTLVRPHLVRPTAPPEVVEFKNPETVSLINNGLWRAAHETGGTAADPSLRLNEFRVALKTGTAEVASNGEKTNHAWLAGYAPAAPSGKPVAQPRIVFAVVVEETLGHGAKVCAPIVRRILEHFAAADPAAYRLDGSLQKTAGD